MVTMHLLINRPIYFMSKPIAMAGINVIPQNVYNFLAMIHICFNVNEMPI